MNTRPLATLCALLVMALPARAQSPNTDIFLAPITRIGDSIIVGRPTNITHRVGYDNQPSFTPDSRSVLYTVQSAGQTDIWRYNIAARSTRQITRTPESEYSAQVMPGGTRFSVVRVERDSTQRLWSFAMNGSAPQLVLKSLKPVGYYAWLGRSTIAAYVLGKPSTLHLVERDGSADTVLARDVGRAVERIPPESHALFSYTQKFDSTHAAIFVLTGRSDTTRFVHQVVRMVKPRMGEAAKTQRETVVDSVVISQQRPYELVKVAGDNEFHTWTPDGVLVSANGTALVRWSGELGAASTWIPVADLKDFGVKSISRLAFSPDGNWLAFVAEPASP